MAQQKNLFFCEFCLTSRIFLDIGATIRIGREMLCLPYAIFFSLELFYLVNFRLLEVNTSFYIPCFLYVRVLYAFLISYVTRHQAPPDRDPNFRWHLILGGAGVNGKWKPIYKLHWKQICKRQFLVSPNLLDIMICQKKRVNYKKKFIATKLRIKPIFTQMLNLSSFGQVLHDI